MVGLLAVEPVELQARSGGVIEDLGARPSQVVAVPATRSRIRSASLPMARGELGLSPGRGVAGQPLAGRLGLAEAAAQLTIGAVAGHRRLDLPGRTGRRSGSNVTATDRTEPDWPSSASMNIGETSIRGQAPIQYVAWTAPSLWYGPSSRAVPSATPPLRSVPGARDPPPPTPTARASERVKAVRSVRASWPG